MARRGRKNQGQGRKKQQQAQFEEMDKYPVSPPHSFARIVRDLRTLNLIYQVIEPPLNKKETEQKDQIMDIFVQALNADIEEIDADPVAYLGRITRGGRAFPSERSASGYDFCRPV